MDEFGMDPGEDVVEHGDDRPPGRLADLFGGHSRGPGRRPGWRPSRAAAVLAAITLTVGLAAGYAAGRSAGEPRTRPQAASASPTSQASTSPAANTVPYNPLNVRRVQLQGTVGGPVLTQAVGACSAQVGRDLQLGIQVDNLSGEEVTLRRVEAELPLGGLKMISQQWEPCGGLPTGYSDDVVGPSSTSWFSVTFQVLVKCPTPYPVMFAVEYDFDGHATTVTMPGFPDLSAVSYSGCPAQ